MIDTVFIVGPTGIGKTDYAIEYALKNNGEIVSADSMQLYKYLDIGSAKPSKDQLNSVKHYLIDEIDPRDGFSVFEYKTKAIEYIKQIAAAGKLPIVCGGTGLYVNALIYDMDFSAPEGSSYYREGLLAKYPSAELLHNHLKELDEHAANIIHPNNIKRVLRAIERLENGEEELRDFSLCTKPSSLLNCNIIQLTMDRDLLYDRINTRVDHLFELGLEAEVRLLMNMGFKSSDLAMKGIGYKEIIDSINSGNTADDAKDLIKQNTRHYAKRQITWFKRYKESTIIKF